MIAQNANKLNLHIVVLTVLAILLVPEVAWANGMAIIWLYGIVYPLSLFLTVLLKLLFIKAFEVPLRIVVHFVIVFIESIFIFISYQIGLHISISLFDVFAPYYHLAFYFSMSLIYMMMAWPLNIITAKKVSQYRHLKSLFLATLFPLIFFSITLIGLPLNPRWENKVYEKRISKPITAEDFFLRGHKVKGLYLRGKEVKENEYRRPFTGDNKAAIADFTQAIALDPKDYRYYLSRGDVYLKEQQFDEAIMDFTKVIELRPDYRRYRVTRAEAYYQKGDYDKAIADVDIYLNYWRFDGEAFYIRGEAYKQKGNLDQAVADFSEALRLGAETKQFQALYARGEAYYLKKDFDRAWSDVHEAERYGRVSQEFLNKLRHDSGRDK